MKKFTTILFALALFVGSIHAQCPAIPGTSYDNAPLVYCGLDGFSSRLFPPGAGGLESPQSWLANCGIVDNSHWIAFLPSFSQATFLIEVYNCTTGQGMQGTIYGMDNNSCDINSLYDVSACYSEDIGVANFTLFASNFVQGEVYYFLLDGFNGDICDYTINIQSMVPFPPLDPPVVNGPSPVSANSTHTYTLDFPNRPDFENPCGNTKQDDCICAPCNYGYHVPTSISVIVPPGATYTINNFYEVEVTFGEESGLVCITLNGYCGTDVYCKYVEVLPLCFNNPAPPGDSCINAPLFCAEYLDDYCSTTAGLTADRPGDLNNLLSCPIDNNAWIRLSPCEDSVSIAFDIGDCRDMAGVEIALLSSGDCDTFNLINDCRFVTDGSLDTLLFTGLTPGKTFFLMIDGINGDECAFGIDLVDGFYLPDTISPPPPPAIDEFKITQISDAYIEGPDCICYDEVATYTYHPAVCIIEEGDCGSNLVSDLNISSGCPLPEEACKNNKPWLVKVDRFPVWHIPEGAEFVGDSTGYTVDVQFDPLEPCKDSVYSDIFFSVDTTCGSPPLPMIPTTGSGTFTDTMFSDTITETVWVEIGCTFMLPDSTLVTWIPSENPGGIPDSFYWRNNDPLVDNVYCPCNNGFSVCGICIDGASKDTDIKINYDFDTETICEPDCFSFGGYDLCAGGQYWLKQNCGFKILNLEVDQPEIFDEGIHFLCPWDCFYLTANNQSYCNEGVYDIIVVDPISGCEDHYLFEIYYEPDGFFFIDNVVEECTSPGSGFYTVSFDIVGSNFNQPYFVNNQPVSGNTFTSAPIASGDSYTFTVASLGFCSYYDIVSGVYTCPCVPETTDLGLFELCAGDCYTLPQNGQDYCTTGNYDIIVTNSTTNCDDHFLFEIIELPDDSPVVTDLSFTCLPGVTSYLVTFNVTGTGPLYVNGDVTNGSYISAPITSGGSYYFEVESSGICSEPVILTGLNTCPCIPDIYDLGLLELCPGDCFTLPQNGQDYCTPGSYDISIPNPTSTCDDRYLFEIQELPLDVIDISGITEVCSIDNNFYTVNFIVNGTGPFLVDGNPHAGGAYTSQMIPSGDTYTFLVESMGPCPQSTTFTVAHTCICTPVTTDLGTFQLCPGDCFTLPQNGQDYCTPGNYDIIVTNSTTNCDDHFLFEIQALPLDVIDISNIVESCSVDNNFYTVSFDINGSGPFFVNGTSQASGTFISDPIPSGDPYSFFVESTGPCPINDNISGSFTCDPCVPTTINLGLYEICAGSCVTIPETGDTYCTPGNFDVVVNDPTTNCPINYIFDIVELPMETVMVANLAQTCNSDNSMYTVEFDIIGNPPFLVNGTLVNANYFSSAPIVTGTPYSFVVESTEFCFVGENVSGTFTCPTCVPEVIDLGTIDVCQGDCFNYNGIDYCTAGQVEVDILNSEGCIDTHRFFLNFVPTTLPSTSNLTELCDVTFSNYTVSFTVEGTPPYFVNGNPLPGGAGFFQSAPILSGSSYLFEVEHSGPCAESIIIQGTFSCQAACSNSAGSLRSQTEYLCEDQAIQVTHNDNEVLGSDDLLEFILFQGADPMSGQIFERNTNGIFAFNSNFMTYGTSYQIVAVVGNQVGGEVDLQDNCLDISNQVIITYYELPVLLTSQTGDKILTCMEPEITLATSIGGGSGQWRFLWEGIGGSSDSVSIDVQIPGTYYFEATDLLTGCSTIDSVKVLENKVFPMIEVQPVLSLDCATDRVTLDASNSEQGSPFEFAWSTVDGQFSSSPNSLLPEVQAAGNYVLQITNTNTGCISEKTIEVFDLEDELTLVDLEIQPLLCNGSNDAAIDVMSVTGGNPAYQYTFDGFEYNDQSSFENLSVGNYELHIEDSKGCTLDTLIAITEPDPMDLGLNDSYLVIMGEPFQVAVNPNFELASIEWTNPNGDVIGNDVEISTLFSRSTTIYISATDINGCQTSEQISVSVPESNNIVFVPSAFSPNNDFNNDQLEIYTHPSVALIQSFKIYSRWGDLVHSCENIQPDPSGNSNCAWDGRLKGQSLDPAVFVYILEVKLINGTQKVLTGDVMIIR